MNFCTSRFYFFFLVFVGLFGLFGIGWGVLSFWGQKPSLPPQTIQLTVPDSLIRSEDELPAVVDSNGKFVLKPVNPTTPTPATRPAKKKKRSSPQNKSK